MAYDLSDKKYNYLHVIRKDGNRGKKVMWLCKCDCGNLTRVATNDLTSGKTKSCGCYNNKLIENLNKTHGLSKHPLYDIWCGIKQRCYYKKHICYDRYGKLGISMCDTWNDFQVFYNDMIDGYKKGLSIDRIDNSKGYSKSNCRWADDITQANNKRNNKLYTYKGITDTLPNLARKHNKKYSFLYNRIKNGMSVKDSFEMPKKNQFK